MSDALKGVRTGAGSNSLELRERVRSLRLPKDSAPRPASKAWLVVLAIAAGAACFGYVQFGSVFRLASADRSANREAEPARAAAAATANSVAKPSSQNADEPALEAKGYVIPARQVLVSPKISGMIEKLSIVEGTRVEKGAVLAELEQIDYQADLDRAEAGLDAAKQRHEELRRGFRKEEIEQAKAELGEAQEQLDKATKDWQRNSALRKTNAISQEEYDSAQSQKRALERRVERLTFALHLMQTGAREERIQAAAADVRQAQADVEKARWRFNNTIIRAPISGTILKKNAEEGNIVNPIAFNGSYSICDMADLSDMEVELTIQERDIARVYPGQPCRVRADAWPERVYIGRVSRVMPIADRAKGAVPVRVKIDIPSSEEGVYLKPEMGAVVSFLKGTAPPRQDAPVATPSDRATSSSPPSSTTP